MVRRVELICISMVLLLCLGLIAYSYYVTQQKRLLIHFKVIEMDQSFIRGINENNSTPPSPPNNIHALVQQEIVEETNDYGFRNHKHLDDFTMVTGGQPIRTLIISTWRTGSTFLGEVMNAIPGNFYHYEPLLHHGIVQIRRKSQMQYRKAIQTLRDLFNCDYTNLDDYLEYGKSHVYLFTHNTRLWEKCHTVQADFCWNATFLNQFCKLFPFHSMKTVRLRLELVEELLRDESLNLNVILLMRDPRGTLQSRKHREWCPGNPDCDRAENLCEDMIRDYYSAIRFRSKYPNRFRVIRYETLSLEPHKYVKKLFKYFHFDYHSKVEQFLDSHTKINVGGVSSTYRDSKATPFHWRTDLNRSEIQEIQLVCDKAMHLWGYKKFTLSPSKLPNFNPLTTYEFSDEDYDAGS